MLYVWVVGFMLVWNLLCGYSLGILILLFVGIYLGVDTHVDV